jgi:hypothetical protein
MLFKCVVGRLELNIFALDPNYLLPLFLNFLVLPLNNIHLFLTPLLPQPYFFSHCLQLSPIHIIYLGRDLKKYLGVSLAHLIKELLILLLSVEYGLEFVRQFQVALENLAEKFAVPLVLFYAMGQRRVFHHLGTRRVFLKVLLLSDKLPIHLVHEFLNFYDHLTTGFPLASPFFNCLLAPNFHI